MNHTTYIVRYKAAITESDHVYRFGVRRAAEKFARKLVVDSQPDASATVREERSGMVLASWINVSGRAVRQ